MNFSKSDQHFVYGIYIDQLLIGFVNDCEAEDTTIELGYVIAPEHQGKGFATEAVKACMTELFRMGYEHIKAGYFEENIASRRVMEKCNMKFEGILKSAVYVKKEYKNILKKCRG